MFEQLGTSENRKKKVAFPEANDHIIACGLTSNDIENVQRETYSFAEEILGLKTIMK